MILITSEGFRWEKSISNIWKADNYQTQNIFHELNVMKSLAVGNSFDFLKIEFFLHGDGIFVPNFESY